MTTSTTPRRVLAIVTDALQGEQPIEEIRRAERGAGTELRVVVPAIEATAFRHTLGDVDEPKREAEQRLRAALAALRAHGIEASGAVGDPDPVQAAQDALLEGPADEVVIFEREAAQARWFEEGLFERARASLEPPLRMVVVHTGDPREERVVAVEREGAGTRVPDAEHAVSLPISDSAPMVPAGDLAGIAIAIVGTIVVAILAAASSADSATESGWAAVAILVAIGIALVNVAHVVGLTLFDSVRYRGGFAKLFRTLSLVGTPVAILVNLAIVILA